MDPLETFKKLRDSCNEVIEGFESEDEAKLEAAMGKFLLLMVELDALK